MAASDVLSIEGEPLRGICMIQKRMHDHPEILRNVAAHDELLNELFVPRALAVQLRRISDMERILVPRLGNVRGLPASSRILNGQEITPSNVKGPAVA
jgi:hypothetical protein